MAYQITTNGHYRPIEYSTDDEPTGEARPFFKYRGGIYFFEEFMRVEEGSELQKLGWNGYLAFGLWGGVVVAYNSQSDMVKVGYMQITYE